MDILLDTCSYIWLRTEPEKLSKKATKAIYDKNNTFFLSSLSVWEINIKVKIGRLKVKGNLEKLTNLQGYEDLIKPISFSTEDAAKITKLTLHHKDPFDLMIICQSLTHSFTILTPDPDIRQYKIKTLW